MKTSLHQDYSNFSINFFPNIPLIEQWHSQHSHLDEPANLSTRVSQISSKKTVVWNLTPKEAKNQIREKKSLIKKNSCTILAFDIHSNYLRTEYKSYLNHAFYWLFLPAIGLIRNIFIYRHLNAIQSQIVTNDQKASELEENNKGLETEIAALQTKIDEIMDAHPKIEKKEEARQILKSNRHTIQLDEKEMEMATDYQSGYDDLQEDLVETILGSKTSNEFLTTNRPFRNRNAFIGQLPLTLSQ